MKNHFMARTKKTINQVLLRMPKGFLWCKHELRCHMRNHQRIQRLCNLYISQAKVLWDKCRRESIYFYTFLTNICLHRPCLLIFVERIYVNTLVQSFAAEFKYSIFSIQESHYKSKSVALILSSLVYIWANGRRTGPPVWIDYHRIDIKCKHRQIRHAKYFFTNKNI